MMRRVIAITIVVLAGLVFAFWRLQSRTTPTKNTTVKRPANPQPPRHFILIVSDALRPDHLGCYGSDKNLTPHIDRLAAQGLVFHNATAVGPWTLSSNPGLFCGRYPHEVFEFGRTRLRDDATTIAEYFHAAGYKTAAFSAHPLIGHKCNFSQGFDTFVFPPGPQKERDRAAVSHMLDFLQANDGRSLFVLLYLFDPHQPYDPQKIPASLKARLASARDCISRGEINAIAGHRKPQIVANPAHEAECSPEEIDLLHALYELDIKDVDSLLGEILEAVGEDDTKTTIVFTSDHGEEWLEHGGLCHNRQMLYNELLHIPLILKIPGRAPAAIDAPVGNLDIAPTLLELAGITPPPDLPGRSLLSSALPPDRPRFYEARHPQAGIRRYGVRVGDRILLHSLKGWPEEAPLPEGGLFEYYDLAHDPHQKNPLPAATQAADLKALLLAHERQAINFSSPQAAQKEVAGAGLPAGLKKELEALGYLGD